MGTKYEAPTVLNYNAAPPSDDGTVSSNNQVSWAKLLSKVGNPLKTYAEAINTQLVTALSTASRNVTANESLTAADHWKTVVVASTVTATITLTLADAVTMANGYMVTLLNESNVGHTIGRATSTDTIGGTTANGVLPPRQSVTLAVNSAANGYYITAKSDFAGSGGRFSVLEYGADPTGATSSVTAFSNAAKNVAAVVVMDYENTTLNHPMAEVAVVTIPAGTYHLPSMVDVGGREVVWLFETGAKIKDLNDSNLTGRVIHPGHKITSKRHYGTRDYACGFSVIANNALGASAGVLGFNSPYNLASYADRDSVGFYAENRSADLVATLVAPNYTSTTVSCPTPVDVKLLRNGMIIDTAHATKYSGMISGWASDGTSITVTGWVLVDGSQPVTYDGTPANGVNAYVNSVTKIWTHNANVFLIPGHAKQAAGFELGMFNYRGNQAGEGADENKVWGYDSVNLGTYKCESAFISRAGAGGLYHGYEAQGSDTGFYANNAITTGFKSKGPNNPFLAVDNTNGRIFSIASDGSIEMGITSVVQPCFIDFNTSGNNIDHDSRIIASGGSGILGSGTLALVCDVLNTTNIRPAVDNLYTYGDASHRPTVLYAVSGTINTSDEREKENIQDIPAARALAMLKFLKSKTYKWRDDQRDAVIEVVKKTRQKTIKTTKIEPQEVIDVVDGVARVTIVNKEIIVEEPQFDIYPVVDENGNQLYENIGRGRSRPRVHKVPVMETYSKDIEVSKSVDKKNVRTHWGFIAQDVEKMLAATGMTSQDFAGLIIDKESGRYGLRYEQMIAPLWSVVQQLVDRVEKLEAKK